MSNTVEISRKRVERQAKQSYIVAMAAELLAEFDADEYVSVYLDRQIEAIR